AAHECLDSGLRRSDEGGSHIFLEQSCVSAKVIFLASLRVLCERPFLFNSTATRNLETLRDRRTLQEMLQRSRHVREVGDADELARAVEADEIANPGEGRDVRDRVFLAHQPRSALEACVQDAEQPTRLADVAVARPLVFELAPGELMEKAHLTEHGPDAPDLKHEPLNRLVARVRVARQETTRLLGQINENGAGLEQRQRTAARAVRIDDRGDLAVRIERHELRRLLIA